MTERRWLDVPFNEKEQAKAAGARWDPQWRRWYAPAPGIPGLDHWDPRTVAERTIGEFRGPLAPLLNRETPKVSMAEATAIFARSTQNVPSEPATIRMKFFPQPADLPQWIEDSGVDGGFAQIHAKAVTTAMEELARRAHADLLWVQFETGSIETNSSTTLIHLGRHARETGTGRWKLLPLNFADTAIAAASENYYTVINIHCELIAAAKHRHRTCQGTEPGVTIRPIYADDLWEDRYEP